MNKQTEWEWEISPEQNWFQLKLGEIWQYKDLLFRFVRRDILASYQQTILGPLWVFLQPLFTTLVYMFIFRRVAKISTDGLPSLLFYLPGSIIWTYFSDCLTGCMYTFMANAYIFSKVYFPRLIVPLSIIVFHSFRISIQLLLFTIIYIYYLITDPHIHPSFSILLLPVLIFLTAAFALGAGLIISVFTAKYRDLDNILQFVLRLFMFAAPIVYPASIVPEKYRFLFWLNPLTSVIEIFRGSFYNRAPVPWANLIWSFLGVFVILFFGILLFKKREIRVMDVI
jgi:lipopolysaccharide transport system permease protein